jgi:uncharacterized damage-inducible protein DinB
MSLKSNFVLMAEYNKWMNESIYLAALDLSHEELTSDRGSFFGSVIGTLNHILVADIIWLKRFAAHPEHLSSLDYLSQKALPEKLSSILFGELTALREERAVLDKVILDFANQLSSEILATNLSYKNTKGVANVKCFAHLIQHFFNHQTHHRGQASTLLSQLGVDLGSTDLLVKIPNA